VIAQYKRTPLYYDTKLFFCKKMGDGRALRARRKIWIASLNAREDGKLDRVVASLRSTPREDGR